MPVALITGASAGFGAAFARKLARRGYDLVLVARRLERLEALKAEIESLYPVSVTPIAADLGSEADIERVAQAVQALPELEILVNNAGFATIGRYQKVRFERHHEMLSVHVLSMMRLTYAALPAMLERRKGAVINVSSLAGFVGMPGGANYNATKAAMIGFSEGLAAELRGTGVVIQALCPGYTFTEFHETPEYLAHNFSRRRISSFIWGRAEPVIDASLSVLWSEKVIVTQGWINHVALFFLSNHIFRPLIRLAIRMLYARR